VQERSRAARLERRSRLRRRGLDQRIVLLEGRVDDAEHAGEEHVRGERPEQQQRDGRPDHVGDPSRDEPAQSVGDQAEDQREQPG
jgi:hypothetical protein